MLSVSSCAFPMLRTSCTSDGDVVLAARCSSAAEQLPLRELDAVKQVQAMPSLASGISARVLVGHRASFRRENVWVKARADYVILSEVEGSRKCNR